MGTRPLLFHLPPLAPDLHPPHPQPLSSLPPSPASLPHSHLPKDKQSYYNNELASPLTAATGEDNYPPPHIPSRCSAPS